MSLRTADYDFELPKELIAHHPPPNRDAARMLVVDRVSGGLSHRSVGDLPEYFEPDDLAVLNNTKVIPARLFTEDGRIEVLLLEERSPQVWVCMARPGKKLKPGLRLPLAGTEVEVLEVLENGERVLRFDAPPDLETHGAIPLPPYLNRAATEEDSHRYQTVYASEPGAVAAPTAGLHFTPEMIGRIPHSFVTLHVGAGTFLPVKSETLEAHKMHEERFFLSEETAKAVNAARRVTAIGTTCVRVLETSAAGPQRVVAGSGRTDIFIYPPYQFRAVDRLLTNFHLPQSTLLMLVSAFAGRELIRAAYEKAVREHYRFYSYGDCMLIL